MRELSLHILDLLQNALEAGATEVDLCVVEDIQADLLSIRVRDNGQGMDPRVLRQALDPFFTSRTTRHVGLGLPLLAAAARRCDGELSIESGPGGGTEVRATFRHSHLDRAPLGNMSRTLLAFLLHGDGTRPDLRYQHRLDDRTFHLDTQAIRSELGQIPLSYPEVRTWLNSYIAQGEAQLATPDQGGNGDKA